MSGTNRVGDLANQDANFLNCFVVSGFTLRVLAVLVFASTIIMWSTGCQKDSTSIDAAISALNDSDPNAELSSGFHFVELALVINSTTVTIDTTLDYQVIGRFSDNRRVTLDPNDVAIEITGDTNAVQVAGGEVVGISYGSVGLVASIYGISSQPVPLSVVPAVVTLEQLVLSTGELELTLGEASVLSVVGEYSDGSTVDLASAVTWIVSNPAVIEMGAFGAVLAAGVGNSQIVVTYQGVVSGVVELEVSPPLLPPFDPAAQASLILSTNSHQYLSGQEGGPFVTQQVSITLHNVGNQPLVWRGYTTAEWLNLSVPTGVIESGQSAFVIASLSNTATSLMAEKYFAQLCFVNISDSGGGGVVPVVLTIGAPPAATGPVYYVDFDAGLDSNSGLSAASPWKRSPGDSAASGVAASTTLLPGSKVIFKGGVHYRGAIIAPQSGALGSPIVFDGNSAGAFGEGKAILNGAEPLTNWTASAPGLFSTSIPSEGFDDLFSINLCNGERLMTLAQGPITPANPIQFDDIANNFVQVPPSAVTVGSISDPINLSGLPADFWVGGYIAIWARPNIVYIKPLTGFNQGTQTLSFEPVDSVYADRNTSYSILNCSIFMDQPGEYVVDEAAMTLTLFPELVSDLASGSITSSVRNVGFDFGGKSFVTVQGFRMLKFAAGIDRWYRGSGVRCRSSVEGIAVLNNEVSLCRSMARAGAITVTNATNSMIAGNYIHRNFKSRGVLSLTSENITLSDNVLYANGGTGLTLFSMVNSTITRNAVLNHMGMHANSMTFYMNCNGCTVTWNEIYGGRNALTTLTASNMLFAHNAFSVNPEFGSYTVADWGDSANLSFYNNVFESPTGKGLWLSSSSLSGAKLHNNILDGNLMAAGAIQASHNIYTTLAWNQNETSLGPTEFVVLDKSLLFLNPGLYDYRATSTSPGIDQGLDVGNTGGSVIGVVDIGIFEN